MPQRPSDRLPVTVKLAKAGIRRIDGYAAERGIDRSEMIRRMLKLAEEQIQKGMKV